MKKEKIIITSVTIIVIIILILSIVLIKTLNRKPITTKEFSEILEKEKYNVGDYSLSYANNDNIKNVFIANKDTLQIEFYIYETDSIAKDLFETDKQAISKDKGFDKEKHGRNYDYYENTTTTNYKYVSRIDNTLMFIDTDVSNRDMTKKIIEKLGY